MIAPTPPIRVQRSAAALRPEGDYVLYWMCAARRTRYNFGLQRAIEAAQALGRPLQVLEALRVDYPWASERHHHFVMQGMAENRARLRAAGVGVHSYVERQVGEGRGLLLALAQRACLVVADEHPGFFTPRMLDAAQQKLDVCLERVDCNGLLPLREPGRDFTTAASFRRHLQKNLRPHLMAFPLEDPLAQAQLPPAPPLPEALLARWPEASDAELLGLGLLATLPIDHTVKPVALRGGPEAAGARLRRFLAQGLQNYAEARNEPSQEGSSGLSPYLHFGHIAAHELVAALLQQEGWDLRRLAERSDGSRQGWWGVSEPAEAFLDQVCTWRELGFNFCYQHPDTYDRLDSLPDWALKSMAEHAQDPRPVIYSLEQLEQARTHDPIWNAAQRQLRDEGVMHNYLRMLWGKHILAWTSCYEDALKVLIHLNNRYALDGRDPNSYSGIFWVLGRFDRAWGPVRPVYGKLRYMTSDSTARKWDLRGYLERYGEA